MPFTFNGFGSRYAGRKNVTTRAGVCPQCGRKTTLQSYDTREFVCILFVPLIPFARYRILDDCASCRRHHRVKLAVFEEQLTREVEPLRVRVRARSTDPAAHAALAGKLFELSLAAEAEAAAHEGLRSVPGDGLLSRWAGELAMERGDFAGAIPHLRVAASALKGDARAHRALGHALLVSKQPSEATTALDAALRIDPSDAVALDLVAHAHRESGNHSYALYALDALTAVAPALATDPEILRRKKACKEQLGFPVTEEERKASSLAGGARAWLTRETGGFGLRPVLLVLGVVAAGAVAFLGVAAWNRSHITVYFDNALAKEVTVTAGPHKVVLPPGERRMKELSPGKYTFVARANGQELERFEEVLVAPPLSQAFDKPPFYVYDVMEARIYDRYVVVYQAKDAPPRDPPGAETIAFRRFFSQSGVDYAFREAPETLNIGKAREVTRIVFDASGKTFNSVAAQLWEEGKPKESEKAVHKALELDRCDAQAWRNLLQILALGEREAEAPAVAMRWIETCPKSALEAHSAYQDARVSNDEGAQVVAEYAELARKEPASARNHYLYARVLQDAEAALLEDLEALRLDPGFLLAHVAAGNELLRMARPAEAYEHLKVGIPADWSQVWALTRGAIAAGKAAEALTVLEPAAKREDASIDRARFDLSLVAGDFQTARMILGKLEKAVKEETAELRSRRIDLFLAEGKAAEADALLDATPALPRYGFFVRSTRFQRHLEEGRFAEAADSLTPKEGEGPLHTTFQMHAAAARLVAGQKAQAAAELSKLLAASEDDEEAYLSEGDRALVEALLGKKSPEAALLASKAEDPGFLPHAHCLLGMRALASGDRAAARTSFAEAVRLSGGIGFPGGFARRRIEGL